MHVKCDVARCDKIQFYCSHWNKTLTGFKTLAELLDDGLQLVTGTDVDTKFLTALQLNPVNRLE